jgi:hypothetical protein
MKRPDSWGLMGRSSVSSDTVRWQSLKFVDSLVEIALSEGTMDDTGMKVEVCWVLYQGFVTNLANVF